MGTVGSMWMALALALPMGVLLGHVFKRERARRARLQAELAVREREAERLYELAVAKLRDGSVSSYGYD